MRRTRRPGRARPRRRPPAPPGTVPRPAAWEFPPDIFWISPQGQVVEGVGHVSMMQERPEAFGFHAGPQGKREIDFALLGLWHRGWVRGRFAGETFSFQLDRPRGDSLVHAQDLVGRFARHVRWVEVDFGAPGFAPATFTRNDFLAARRGLWRTRWRR